MDVSVKLKRPTVNTQRPSETLVLFCAKGVALARLQGGWDERAQTSRQGTLRSLSSS